MKRLYCCLLGLAVLLLLAFPGKAEAQALPYTVQYDFEYTIDPGGNALDVTLLITLTSLRSDLFIEEYAIRIPKNIAYKNLRVSNEHGKVPYISTDGPDYQKLTFKLAEPDDEPQTQTLLRLHYSIDNVYTHTGTIHEIIMPLMVEEEGSVVNATLKLPDDFDHTLSLSKPRPTAVEFRTIRWENTNAQTLYALFGESQMYTVHLDYSLSNTSLSSQKKVIPFPPETLYQKIYVGSVSPKPDRTYTDTDGNYMAEYTVGPRSSFDVTFKGYVEVFTRPQGSLREIVRRSFAEQQPYLLTEHTVWALGDQARSAAENIHTATDIYASVVDRLEYSHQRLRSSPKRMGAQQAFLEPRKAVCMEYTDLFIALAREKGIPARQVIGYGYSQSSDIRPQALAQDVLHVWPEIYDRQQELWLQLDPTWGDTSGIDYMSSFDVNHIALAIQGKHPSEPAPAGFYKSTPKRDVTIDIASKKPPLKKALAVEYTFDDEATVGTTYSDTVYITNNGNTFLHSVSVVPEAPHMLFSPTVMTADYLAPFETRAIPISFTPQDGYEATQKINFTFDGTVLGSESVRIRPAKSNDMYIVIGSLAGIAILCLIAFKLRSHV